MVPVAYLITLILGVGLGLVLRRIPAFWRAQRRAQAAASQEAAYEGGVWFADTTPPAPPSQAQIGDAPVVSKISLRSRPARPRHRRTGR